MDNAIILQLAEYISNICKNKISVNDTITHIFEAVFYTILIVIFVPKSLFSLLMVILFLFLFIIYIVRDKNKDLPVSQSKIQQIKTHIKQQNE